MFKIFKSSIFKLLDSLVKNFSTNDFEYLSHKFDTHVLDLVKWFWKVKKKRK